MGVCAKMKIKNKHASMTLATTFLVLATLVLVIFAIVVFNSKQNSSLEELGSVGALENVYVRSETLNFYLKETADQVTSKTDAIKDFSNRLVQYKDSEGKYVSSDLLQIEYQLADGKKHIWVEGDILKIHFDITFLEIIYPPDISKGKSYEFKYAYPFSYERRLT